MAKQTKTIAFRLHDVLEVRLAEAAAERQISIGEHVRRIVIQHLSGDTNKVADAVAVVGEAVKRLESDLRTVAAELLINGGHAEPEEALAWVRANLARLSRNEKGPAR